MRKYAMTLDNIYTFKEILTVTKRNIKNDLFYFNWLKINSTLN